MSLLNTLLKYTKRFLHSNEIFYNNKNNFIADAVEIAKPGVIGIKIPHKQSGFWNNENSGIPRTIGTGFIVTESGLALTNHHVTRQNEILEVELNSGEIIGAKVVDENPVADITIIQLHNKDKRKFPAINLASSSNIRLGEWVVAIGNPLSLSNSVSCGIISQVHRSSSEIGFNNSMSYIQTDAAINPGNSGGPLIDLNGEAIGIISMMLQNTQGIGFAIPIDIAKQFLLQTLKANDSQKHPNLTKYYIGIKMIDMNESLSWQLKGQNSKLLPFHGVLVCDVVQNSPASKSGLLPRDVIVAVDGVPIISSKALSDKVMLGIPLLLRVYRNNVDFIELKVDPIKQ